MMNLKFDRRSLIAGAGALTASAWLRPAFGAESDLFPIVETAEGKLRGVVSGGISVFKGVRYGADTSGKNRFRAPQPVQKWAGVRDAFNFGNISPQVPGDRRSAYADLIMFDRQVGGMGEDCLCLNVWTPEAKRGGKRPVLVHYHGGGFYGGSGNGPGYDGEQLARYGDCVVVVVTHRLSSLGYLYLGDEGEFADSGSVGMQDLVASLDWVQRNAEAFGGDPKKTLIFGQSGGGAKVSLLTAMPGARGKFRSAGIMSGSALTAMTREAAVAPSDTLLGKLGLTRKDIGKLQEIPFTALLAAQADIEAADRSRGEAPRSFSPVLGAAIPRHPFAPDASPVSADIPMIVSTVLDERAYRESDFGMGWDKVLTMLKGVVGDEADKVLTMYRDEDSAATPFIINARIITDRTFRVSAHAMAERKAAQGGAPVYTYLWEWPSPAFGGRYGAPHGSDVSPSLHDIRMPLTGPTYENLRLADQLASAWVSFAETGNPNNPKTPNWPAFDNTARMTMVWGKPSQAVSDPRGEIRKYWASKAS